MSPGKREEASEAQRSNGGEGSGTGLTFVAGMWTCESLLRTFTHTHPYHPNQNSKPTLFYLLPLFFSFFFFLFLGRGEPLSVFLGASLGVWFRIKAQAAARVGRPGISKGRVTPPNESAGRNPPAAIAKEIYRALAIYGEPPCFALAQLS